MFYIKKDVCKGNDTCEVGYEGPLCELCNIEENYGKSGLFECS